MASDAESFGLLQSAVQRFINERLISAEDIGEEMDEVPEDIVSDIKELGLFGLSLPEKYGGIGLSMEQEAGVICDIGHTSFAFRSVLAQLSASDPKVS